MLDFVKSELLKLNIDLVSCISLDDCKITRPYLLEKKGISSGSVIIFAVPYYTSENNEYKNISSYAVSKDYHLFFTSLFEKLINALQEKYPNNKFAGFTDHSPINETEAAAKASLGMIGKNHLLITKKYSSYVFIGEIITDALLPHSANEIQHCSDCGKCASACPVNMDSSKCLSSITQKKGELSDDERTLIKKYGCAWGCDICQNVCPYTETAIKNGTIYSNVDFFKENRTSFLSSAMIDNMSEEEFVSRAYSWRGKNTVKRNLNILEGKDE